MILSHGVWYYPNVCDTTQGVWYYPNVCDTTQYVCDTIPMCMILSHGVILSCGVGSRAPIYIVSDC